jgi:5'-nucleotidase
MVGMLIPKFVLARPWWKRLRPIHILHTNDFHSHIEPFAANDAKYPNQGGISRIKSQIDNIRLKEKHTILLDCGDIMQGTPYFNIFGGAMEIEWMNRAGYKAGTIGNHDFDNGLDSLAQWVNQANFPFVNSNYKTKGTVLEGLLKPYTILTINDRKIGITGVGINPEGLVPEANCRGIIYTDPINAANGIAKQLVKDHKCDMVILLSHLGFSYNNDQVDDKHLAKNSEYIDLILGGHTHTFMDKPFETTNKIGKRVIIHQVGWAGLKLGHLQFEI